MRLTPYEWELLSARLLELKHKMVKCLEQNNISEYIMLLNSQEYTMLRSKLEMCEVGEI